MNAARVFLEKLDEERTQSTAMEDLCLPNECIFPLPLPRCRNEGSGKACEQMVYSASITWPSDAGMGQYRPVAPWD